MKKVLNVQATLDRIDNDSERLKELYTIALQEFPKWKERLKEKISEGQIEAVQKVAHSYKGSSATLGAEILHQMFLDMEYAARDKDFEKVKQLYDESFHTYMEDLTAAIKEYIEQGE